MYYEVMTYIQDTLFELEPTIGDVYAAYEIASIRHMDSLSATGEVEAERMALLALYRRMLAEQAPIV